MSIRAVLQVYFNHKVLSVVETRQNLSKIGKHYFESSNDDGISRICFLDVNSATNRLLSIAQSCVREENCVNFLSRASHCLAALDRADENVRYSLLAAVNHGRDHKVALFTSMAWLASRTANCMINEMLAIARNQQDLAALWREAYHICDDVFQDPDGISLPTTLNHIPKFCDECDHYDINQMDVCDSRVSDYMHRSWAYAVLAHLKKSIALSRVMMLEAAVCERRKKTAGVMANCYNCAQHILMLSSTCTHADLISICVVAAAAITQVADRGRDALAAGREWEEGRLMHNVTRNTDVLERYVPELEKLHRDIISPRKVSAGRLSVELPVDCQLQLEDIIQELLTSPIVHDPTLCHDEHEEELELAVNNIQESMQQWEQIDTDSDAQRIVYYRQQTQCIDRSLSPAHKLMAECWEDAAEQALKAENQNVAAREEMLWRAVLYTQLAEGVLFEAAEAFLDSARAEARSRAVEAGLFLRGAELLMKSGKLCVAYVRDTSLPGSRQDGTNWPTEALDRDQHAGHLLKLARTVVKVDATHDLMRRVPIIVALRDCVENSGLRNISWHLWYQISKYTAAIASSLAETVTSDLPRYRNLSSIGKQMLEQFAQLTLQFVNLCDDRILQNHCSAIEHFRTHLHLGLVALNSTLNEENATSLPSPSAAQFEDHLRHMQLSKRGLEASLAGQLAQSRLYELAYDQQQLHGELQLGFALSPEIYVSLSKAFESCAISPSVPPSIATADRLIALDMGQLEQEQAAIEVRIASAIANQLRCENHEQNNYLWRRAAVNWQLAATAMLRMPTLDDASRIINVETLQKLRCNRERSEDAERAAVCLELALDTMDSNSNSIKNILLQAATSYDRLHYLRDVKNNLENRKAGHWYMRALQSTIKGDNVLAGLWISAADALSSLHCTKGVPTILVAPVCFSKRCWAAWLGYAAEALAASRCADSPQPSASSGSGSGSGSISSGGGSGGKRRALSEQEEDEEVEKEGSDVVQAKEPTAKRARH